jgi:hypothetical protein
MEALHRRPFDPFVTRAPETSTDHIGLTARPLRTGIRPRRGPSAAPRRCRPRLLEASTPFVGAEIDMAEIEARDGERFRRQPFPETGHSRINQRRHGWACPGHPRSSTQEKENVCRRLAVALDEVLTLFRSIGCGRNQTLGTGPGGPPLPDSGHRATVVNAGPHSGYQPPFPDTPQS